MLETSRRQRLVRRAGAASAGIPLAVLGILAVPGVSQAGEVHARATLLTADGSKVGTVVFRVTGSKTEVRAHLGLPTSAKGRNAFHGFHIHANDNPANGSGCLADPAKPASTWFVSADGHLAQQGQSHSTHQGDLPSLLVNADGTADLRFTTQRFTRSDLRGRAVILHTGPDNFGNVPVGPGADQYRPNSQAAVAKTAATGNSGDRLACGLISLDD